MTQLERRDSALRRMKARAIKAANVTVSKSKPTPDAQGHKRKHKKDSLAVPFAESEALPYTAPEEHHHISSSRNLSYHVPSWLHENGGDPATRVCVLSQFS